MTHLKPIQIAVFPGDGIGQTVTHESLAVLRVFDIPLEISFGEIGWSCWKTSGNPIPEKTWDLIQASEVTLVGAITSKPEKEAIQALPDGLRKNPPQYVSPIIQLRQNWIHMPI